MSGEGEGGGRARVAAPMRVLVTGATGFIGFHVARGLAAAGHRVHPTFRGERPPEALAPFAATARRADIRDPESLVAAVSEVDVVVHLAGLTRARSEAEFNETNAEGVGRLVRALREHAPRLQRFVYVSSLSAGGPSAGAVPVSEDDPPRPVSAYGRSKLLGEARLREAAGDAVPWTVIRPPIVYGPGERDLLALFRYAARGIVPMLGGGRRTYSLVHARDLTAAILAVTQSGPAAGQVYYVAEPRSYSGRELVEHIGASVGRKPRVIPVPHAAAAIAAAIGSSLKPFLGRPPLVTLDKLPELGASWVCSSEKIARACGFRCGIAFPEGARETAAWYRDARWL